MGKQWQTRGKRLIVFNFERNVDVFEPLLLLLLRSKEAVLSPARSVMDEVLGNDVFYSKPFRQETWEWMVLNFDCLGSMMAWRDGQMSVFVSFLK